MGYTQTRQAALAKIQAIAETESDLQKLSYACAAVKELADGDFVVGVEDVKVLLASRLLTVINTSTSLEDIAYASKAITKLEVSANDIATSEAYTIGTPGVIGFGVGALRTEQVPVGFTLPTGHADRLSPNYGLVIDAQGSYMRFIPKFYFRWNGNNAEVRTTPATGFALHEAFRYCDIGFLRDTTHVSIIGGKPIAVPGTAPASTHAANNGIGQLVGINNTYKDLITAFKDHRSIEHHVESIFESNALAILAKAHSAAASSVFECAFNDVVPYLPKGNNNNALKDSSDPSVVFQYAGNEAYPACALTASASNLAKTTHNGQACGVADVNGNLWRVNVGMTKANETDGIFQILKTTVNPNDLTALNLHDIANYDDIDLSALMPTIDDVDWQYGNGASQVFSSNQTTSGTDDDLRVTCAGFPLVTGMSSGGTDAFGSDTLYRKWKTNLLPIVGGYWNNSSNAGVFARALSYRSSNSDIRVGGAACVSL